VKGFLPRKPYGWGAGCLAVFGLPFLAVGVFVAGLFGNMFLDYRRAASWDRVPARIESAEFEVSHGKGASYSVKARYSYEYGGRTYTGSRIAADTGGSSDARHRERYELLRQHKESGQPFLAWVNPARPQESLLFREMTTMSWALLPFGLVFAGVGGALFVGGLWSIFGARRRARRLAADPQRPWRADPRWLAGFVFDEHAGRKLAGGWTAAVFLSLFVSIFVIGLIGAKAPLWVWGVFGIFVLLALALLAGAACSTVQFTKYGSPRLAMAEVPAVPGRTLTAIVLCRRHVDVEGAFKVTLKCEQKTGSGKQSQTETLHEESVEVAQDLAGGSAAGTAVPVELPIPGDLPGTTPDDADPSVKWTLAVKAATPGVDFSAEFDLPVFRVEDENLIEQRPEGLRS
jgi:hypothetical protein